MAHPLQGTSTATDRNALLAGLVAVPETAFDALGNYFFDYGAMGAEFLQDPALMVRGALGNRDAATQYQANVDSRRAQLPTLQPSEFTAQEQQRWSNSVQPTVSALAEIVQRQAPNATQFAMDYLSDPSVQTAMDSAELLGIPAARGARYIKGAIKESVNAPSVLDEFGGGLMAQQAPGANVSMAGGSYGPKNISGYRVDEVLLDNLRKTAPEAIASISQKRDQMTLNRLEIPKDSRNAGIGSAFMDELTGYADRNGKTIALTADGDYGGSKAGQERFYRRFGFVPNKGRNKDYEISENMIRRPGTINKGRSDPQFKQSVIESRGEVDDGYRMAHTSPEPEGKNSLDDMSDIYGDDLYGDNGAMYYGGGDPLDQSSINILRSLRGNPDADVTLYRAVPKDAPDTINSGDWVTVNKGYAKTHGEGPMRGDYKIISQKAKARDVYTNGDSLHEQGYHPK